MTDQPSYRAVLKPRRARPFFGRHPWVFAGAISHMETECDESRVAPEEIPPGVTVDLFSAESEFVARGLFNANSNIRLRLYSWNEGERLGRDFWRIRIADAIESRRRIMAASTDTNACRLIFSEADGLSGLTVDRYDDWLLIQFTSLALYQQSNVIISLLRELLNPRGIVLRTEKRILELEGLDIEDGLLSGEEPPQPLFIQENKIRYGLNVMTGQKTGFFLDQRENRQAVARYTSNHRVLDLFCYTGGFSLTAMKLGRAKSSLGIDSSESAITAARANADLNDLGGRCDFRRSDVNAALDGFAAEGRVFDTIVVDPPKMARRRSGLDKAMRGYFNLNRKTVGRLTPGGILVSCSCSGLVGRDDFEEMLLAVAQNTGRDLQILEARGAAPDHPVSVTCQESNYLKCYICRVS
jgi:23S rRNA (cytosine1962-C5)-methyltransferase